MALDRSKFGGRGLQDAVQRSAQSVNDSGGFRNYIMDTGRPVVRKIPAGTFVFDIVPFIAKKDFGNIKAGTVQYVLDVWAHTNVGPTKDMVICPASTLGLPCPICEERSRLEAAGADQNQLKAMKAKRRVVYNVWVHDAARAEENKGVQILEGAHFSFEKNIQAIARHPVTGEYIFFADIDQGRSIAFTRTGTGATDTRYDGFQFLDRPPLPDAIVEQGVPLESFVEVLSYEELNSKLHAGQERLQEPDDVQAAPAHQGPAFAGQAAPTYGQTMPPQQAAPTYGQAAPTYGQTVPPQQQEPVYKASPTYSAPSTPPEQVQAAPVQAAPVQAAPSMQPMQCPVSDIGGVFGETIDKFPQCGACDIWDDCAVAKDSKNA